MRTADGNANARGPAATVVLVAALLVPAAAAEQPVPTPIGRGPAYHPSAVGPLAAPTRFRCRHTSLLGRLRVHVELFSNRRVVIVPAGIGVAGVRATSFGRIRTARCHRALWTLEPTGVVNLGRRGLRLGDFFTVWRQPLGTGRLLGFRARRGGSLLVFRNGHRVTAPAARLVLRDRDEIVLELNGFVAPHRSYLFPREHR